MVFILHHLFNVAIIVGLDTLSHMGNAQLVVLTAKYVQMAFIVWDVQLGMLYLMEFVFLIVDMDFIL